MQNQQLINGAEHLHNMQTQLRHTIVTVWCLKNISIYKLVLGGLFVVSIKFIAVSAIVIWKAWEDIPPFGGGALSIF